MSNRTKSIAFHNKYERATLGSQLELDKGMSWKEAIVLGIVITPLILMIANLILGID